MHFLSLNTYTLIHMFHLNFLTADKLGIEVCVELDRHILEEIIKFQTLCLICEMELNQINDLHCCWCMDYIVLLNF